jgi:hypothetical protein
MKPSAVIPISQLSGESHNSILGNTQGNIFISPSYEAPNTNNELQVQFVESTTQSGDVYESNRSNSIRSNKPFVFGPAAATGRVYPPDFKVSAPAYVPTFNNSFCFMGTRQNTVSAVLYDTVSLTNTIIFY